MSLFHRMVLFSTVLYVLGLLGYYLWEKETVTELGSVTGEIPFQVQTEKNDPPEELEEIFVVTFPLDLNNATLEELDALPNIGQQRASDIIAYREAQGGFQTIEEVMEISGIGVATYEAIKDLVYLSPLSQVA